MDPNTGQPVVRVNGEQLNRHNACMEELLKEAQATSDHNEKKRLEEEASAILDNQTDLLRSTKKARKTEKQQQLVKHHISEAKKFNEKTFTTCTDELTVREYFKLKIVDDMDRTDTAKGIIDTTTCDFKHGDGLNDDQLSYLDNAVRAVIFWLKVATADPSPVLDGMQNLKGIRHKTSLN